MPTIHKIFVIAVILVFTAPLAADPPAMPRSGVASVRLVDRAAEPHFAACDRFAWDQGKAHAVWTCGDHAIVSPVVILKGSCVGGVFDGAAMLVCRLGARLLTGQIERSVTTDAGPVLRASRVSGLLL